MEVSDRCKTEYPIFMIHGFGYRDRKIFGYWGRIPKILEKAGASIYYGNQDSNGTVKENAAVIKKNILRVIEETGCERVNIIAHSKGGLDARYMISSLGMEDRVASLITLSTPHRGSKTMDFIMKLPKFFLKTGSWLADRWFSFLGDEKPETYKALKSFTTEAAKSFNDQNPDCEGAYYESYSFIMKKALSDLFMAVPYTVVRLFDGENDGLVAPWSSEWTNYKGIYEPIGKRGISHNDIVDFRRHRFSLISPEGEKFSDITEFYIALAEGLKNRGL